MCDTCWCSVIVTIDDDADDDDYETMMMIVNRHLDKMENHPEEGEAKDHVSCCHCYVHLENHHL